MICFHNGRKDIYVFGNEIMQNKNFEYEYIVNLGLRKN